MTPPDYRQRVIEEHAQLGERLAKLEVFMSGERFKGLPMDEQTRLYAQCLAMRQYWWILADRIRCFV